MKILVQCNELPPVSCGGIGHYVQAQCHWLQDSEVDVTVVGIYDKTKFDEPHPFPVIRLRRIPKLGTVGLILNQIRFHLYLTYHLTFVDRSVQLIEYQDYEGFGAFHWHRIPFVVRAQDSGFYAFGKYYGGKWYNFRKSIAWLFHRRGIAKANHVVYSAHAAKRCSEEFVKNPNNTVVHNFIAPKFTDTDPAANSNSSSASGKPYLFFFGTVTEEKGIFLLLDAFQKLLDEGMDIELKIAGRLAHQSIKTRIDGLEGPAAERVSLLGRVSDQELIDLIKGAAVVVFPSLRENLPLAWIEAMCIGKVVIGSNIPVSSEIIEDGVTGFICELDSQSLAATIQKAIQLSDDQRSKIETNAKESAIKKFSQASKMEENIQIWKDVVGEESPSEPPQKISLSNSYEPVATKANQR